MISVRLRCLDSKRLQLPIACSSSSLSSSLSPFRIGCLVSITDNLLSASDFWTLVVWFGVKLGCHQLFVAFSSSVTFTHLWMESACILHSYYRMSLSSRVSWIGLDLESLVQVQSFHLVVHLFDVQVSLL